MILSAERTAPGIAPLESLGLPSLLDGSQGRNRGPEEKSALDASNDLEAIHAWLASRASNPNTRSAYQKEAERFLLWCIMEKNTALSSVTVPQASQYLRWLEDLARLTPVARSRFLPRSGLERRAKDGIPPLGALSTARFPTQAGVRL